MCNLRAEKLRTLKFEFISGPPFAHNLTSSLRLRKRSYFVLLEIKSEQFIVGGALRGVMYANLKNGYAYNTFAKTILYCSYPFKSPPLLFYSYIPGQQRLNLQICKILNSVGKIISTSHHCSCFCYRLHAFQGFRFSYLISSGIYEL